MKRSAIGSAIFLLGLFLAGAGGVAAASPNDGAGESAEHRNGTATERAQDEQARDDQAAAAAESPQSDEQDPALNEPQPASNADFSGNGANETGAYDSTRDGSPSANGNGDGAAVGQPCAGCVGKADNKNPAGQFPDGSDANKGYECDDNSGIGRTNPAHTGCVTDTIVPNEPENPETPVIVLGTTFTRTPPASVLSADVVVAPAGFLAVTGSSSGLITLALAGLAMILVGAILFSGRRLLGIRRG